MLRKSFLVVLLLALAQSLSAQSNATFTIGAYNVENWNSIERNKKPDQPKAQAAKDAVANVIADAHPDVLGLEEMGNTNDFAELRGMLQAKGLEYPYWEHVQAHDQDRHVCLLSKFPIIQRSSRTDYTYTLAETTTAIGRGILDVTLQVNDHYSFRAVVVHLKSKRQAENTPDQALMRLEEAQLLRTHIGKILKKDPNANLIAMGDFNDTPDTAPIKTVIGEPPFALFSLPCRTTKGYEGTHLWRSKGEWSRIDYLLASPGLSNEFIEGSAKIHEGRDAAEGSDHRLIFASFQAHDIGRAPAPAERVQSHTAPPAKGLPTASAATILYSIILGLLAIVIVLAVLLMYTRRQRLESKQ